MRETGVPEFVIPAAVRASGSGSAALEVPPSV